MSSFHSVLSQDTENCKAVSACRPRLPQSKGEQLFAVDPTLAWITSISLRGILAQETSKQQWRLYSFGFVLETEPPYVVLASLDQVGLELTERLLCWD